jgi:membrane dipeptidase
MSYFKVFAIVMLMALPFAAGCQQATFDNNRDKAIAILESVPLIDGHNDVPIAYRGRVGYKLSAMDFWNTRAAQRPMHTDIERLRAGRVGGQFWSVYVSPNQPEPTSVLQTMEQIDFVYRLAQKYPDEFGIALTADEVEREFAAGRIASLIGIEGGHSIGNSLGALRQFYNLGARYMTLTHSRTLDWADSATDEAKNGGLTDFGREVIREMNWVGMLVDLSHVSPMVMSHALDVTEAPVIYSHSSARAVADHARNAPDSILHRLKANNGLIMVTFVPSFISDAVNNHEIAQRAEQTRLRELYPEQADKVEEGMIVWNEANPAPRATLSDVADHIEHIRNLIGAEHVGIGGDYDGIRSLPDGLGDVSTYPDLFAELLNRGFSDDELKQIAGLNLLRVMRGAEAVAARLQKERGPSEMLFSDTESAQQE